MEVLINTADEQKSQNKKSNLDKEEQAAYIKKENR